MPTVKTAEELMAELTTLTRMSVQDLNDFLSATPAQHQRIVQGFRDQNWTKNPDIFQATLSVIAVIGTVAGAVTGVAGTASAVAALNAL